MNYVDIDGTLVVPSSENMAYEQTNNRIDVLVDAFNQQIGNRIRTVTSRIDSIISAATVDSELIDIRQGADGTVYNSAGTAVRTQLEKINNKLSDIDDSIMQYNAESEHYSIRNGYYIDGEYISDPGYKTKIFEVSSLQGQNVLVSSYAYTTSIPIVSFFVIPETFISQITVETTGYYSDYEVTIPGNARYAAVTCKIGTYDDVNYSSKSILLKYKDYVDVGNVSDNVNTLNQEVATIQEELVSYRAPLFLNQWYGKKVVWIGTSGSFGTNATTSYPKELSEHLGFELINASVPGQAIHTTANGGIVGGGSTVLSIAEYQALGVTIAQEPLPYVPGGSYNNYYRTYEHIFSEDNADADLWVFDVFPNNNDWSLTDWNAFNREEWRYNDNSSFASHRTTFYGALMFMLNELYNLNPEARVVFIIGALNNRPQGIEVADKLKTSALRYRTFDIWGLINSNVKTNTYLYSLGGTNTHPSTKAHEIMGKILVGEFLRLA